MRRGQQIVVKWADILASPAEDPTEADLYIWSNPGYFYCWKTVTKLGRRIRCLVMTTAEGEDGGHAQSGYLCIPANLVLSIVEVVDED